MLSKKDLENIYVVLGRTHLHDTCNNVLQELINNYEYTDDDIEQLELRESYVQADIKSLTKTVQAIDEEASIEIYINEN